MQTLTRKGAKNELLILKTLPSVNLRKKLFFATALTHRDARHGGDVLLTRQVLGRPVCDRGAIPRR